ncbi:hypothetical protein M407DRAFT_172795 [Tulasnella calospora MUT 4182]|uniref:Uncharacterized protein n=1 Tax=Tulasnella calospora MUT 4182 TaxID=1051891 RepID=A0A0C3M681_9AGAM|nr:hypothetical protein M407DRAFT_172795 [Tulasnella calospora MUT 4182]
MAGLSDEDIRRSRQTGSIYARPSRGDRDDIGEKRKETITTAAMGIPTTTTIFRFPRQQSEANTGCRD